MTDGRDDAREREIEALMGQGLYRWEAEAALRGEPSRAEVKAVRALGRTDSPIGRVPAGLGPSDRELWANGLRSYAVGPSALTLRKPEPIADEDGPAPLWRAVPVTLEWLPESSGAELAAAVEQLRARVEGAEP